MMIVAKMEGSSPPRMVNPYFEAIQQMARETTPATETKSGNICKNRLAR